MFTQWIVIKQIEDGGLTKKIIISDEARLYLFDFVNKQHVAFGARKINVSFNKDKCAHNGCF
jgi:hypothetical protein